jgi:hypothetical protein
MVISSSSTEPRSAGQVLPSFLPKTLHTVQLGTKDETRNSATDGQKERILAFIDAALAVVENDTDFYDEHVKHGTAKPWPHQQ